MFKKLVLALGILAFGLVGSCVFMVGRGALLDATQNKEVAVEATRQLAKAWNVNDVRPYFTTNVLRQINFDSAQATMNSFKPLGKLTNVTSASQTEYRVHKSFGGETSTTATVVIQGAFENGAATITVKLANDGPAMKVVHIHVHAPGPLVVRERA